MPKEYPRLQLVKTIRDTLATGVVSVNGRVAVRKTIPNLPKTLSIVVVHFGGENIEARGRSPLEDEHTATIDITGVCRGEDEKAQWEALCLAEEIHGAMRELQSIDGTEKCLVDVIRLKAVSEIGITPADKAYCHISLTYEAVYVTEEGTPGKPGPGVPDRNVLDAYRKAKALWEPKRGNQKVTAEDDLNYEE